MAQAKRTMSAGVPTLHHDDNMTVSKCHDSCSMPVLVDAFCLSGVPEVQSCSMIVIIVAQRGSGVQCSAASCHVRSEDNTGTSRAAEQDEHGQLWPCTVV
jgi:hypothetical protein